MGLPNDSHDECRCLVGLCSRGPDRGDFASGASSPPVAASVPEVKGRRRIYISSPVRLGLCRLGLVLSSSIGFPSTGILAPYESFEAPASVSAWSPLVATPSAVPQAIWYVLSTLCAVASLQSIFVELGFGFKLQCNIEDDRESRTWV
uniref:Uncharacterized protein n=1 Tax=Setaria viridis TaxID=4556 RepID=A0A4V6D2N7_SETVI|nr:hypothetical protein SEVIR_8G038100v2 [Setaria viridis]